MTDILNWSTGYSTYSHGYPAFDANYMYFPDTANGRIVRTNISDGTVNNANFATGLSPNGCLIYNGFLYISNNFVGGMDGTISRINLSNNVKTTYWAQIPYVGVDIGSNSMVTDGTYIYVSCTNNWRIYKIEINTPTNITIFLNQIIVTPRALALYGSYLYVASDSAYGITRVPLSNPSAYKMNWATIPTTNSYGNASFGLAIYQNYIYASAPSPHNNIYRISLEDPSSNFLWKSSIGDSLRGITVNGTYLYSFNGNDGSINRYFIDPVPPTIPPCFKEGTKILTMKGYKLVQDLRKGDMVKTLKNDYKPIEMIGKKEFIHNPTPEDRVKEQLYVCSKPEFDKILEPLVITGCHSILVGEFVSEAQRQKTIEVNGDIYLTDNKYRLPACAHHQTTVYDQPGTYTIYHLALENDDYFMNYGIYANGLLVESCSRRYLKERSNMELIE